MHGAVRAQATCQMPGQQGGASEHGEQFGLAGGYSCASSPAPGDNTKRKSALVGTASSFTSPRQKPLPSAFTWRFSHCALETALHDHRNRHKEVTSNSFKRAPRDGTGTGNTSHRAATRRDATVTSWCRRELSVPHLD